jgi:hypothetical protein
VFPFDLSLFDEVGAKLQFWLSAKRDIPTLNETVKPFDEARSGL